jgi:predicted nucleic acid-binding protein
MNVVDTSGWIEYLNDTRNADNFAKAIETSDTLLVPTRCVYEVFKVVKRTHNEATALEILDFMRRGTVIDLTFRRAIDAAEDSANLKLAMGDAMIYSIAQEFNATLWTQDAHFEGLPRVKYFEKISV